MGVSCRRLFCLPLELSMGGDLGYSLSRFPLLISDFQLRWRLISGECCRSGNLDLERLSETRLLQRPLDDPAELAVTQRLVRPRLTDDKRKQHVITTSDGSLRSLLSYRKHLQLFLITQVLCSYLNFARSKQRLHQHGEHNRTYQCRHGHNQNLRL